MIIFDSSGTIVSISRVFYNQNGWQDSGRATSAKSDAVFSGSMRYTWAGDTLVQSYNYNGETSSEISRYLFNSSGIPQKQLHFLGDTLIETTYYYYNPAGKLIKEFITNFSGEWVGADSIVYNYDNDNHLVSNKTYYKSLGWDYTEYEHDAQGKILKVITFNLNSTTQKDQTYVYIFLNNNSIRERFAGAPKKPGIRVDRNCTLLSLNPSAIHQIRVFDARGALLKNIRPDEFNSLGQYRNPGKAYLIKAVTNNGTVIGKKIDVR
jgi:hypothetical protein